MYPMFRLGWQLFKHRNDPPLGIFDTHESRHICLPLDIDPWMELNNGRTLTIFDLGRIPLAQRTGLSKALIRNRWGLTMAGASVRYRRRIRTFDRFTMKSRALGWDDKFFYLEQAMFRPDGEAANHVLYRSAVTGASGIVPPTRVAGEVGHAGPSPELPDWTADWISAEAQRPWPPMTES